jgi:Spy/CpxP family protein refolding chaperone
MTIPAIALSMAFAQGPGGGMPPGDPIQHRIDRLTAELSLTAAQQEQAKTIFTKAATDLAGLRTNMSTARQTLDSAVKANNIAGIDQAAAGIGNLTAQETSISAKAEAAFYQILTPDQQTKWNSMRPRGGSGMMGGPGGRMMGRGPRGQQE